MKKKKPSTKCNYGPPIDLRAIEEEVLREGQEWMRRRLTEKLREQSAAFSPDRDADAPECPASDADG